jgi:hypothetical protein
MPGGFKPIVVKMNIMKSKFLLMEICRLQKPVPAPIIAACLSSPKQP